MLSDGSLVSKMELKGQQVADPEYEWRNETLRSSYRLFLEFSLCFPGQSQVYLGMTIDMQ